MFVLPYIALILCMTPLPPPSQAERPVVVKIGTPYQVEWRPGSPPKPVPLPTR